MTKPLLAMCIALVLAGCGASQSTTSTPPGASSQQHDAIAYLRALSHDAVTVATTVDVVVLDVKHKADMNTIAQDAQGAHDNIDSVRASFASLSPTASGPLGDAEAEVFAAAGDLKNAMGALVAWTGDPNPATLAHFSSQYSTARGEWNDGVRTIWRIAGKQEAPTL